MYGEHSPGKSLPWTSPAALREKGTFCYENFFTAETSCFSQSNHKVCRMVCTPSGSFQCLGDSFKTGFKMSIFPCIPGVFTIAWNKSGCCGGGKLGPGILEGIQLFQKQTEKMQIVRITNILVLPPLPFQLNNNYTYPQLPTCK